MGFSHVDKIPTWYFILKIKVKLMSVILRYLHMLHLNGKKEDQSNNRINKNSITHTHWLYSTTTVNFLSMFPKQRSEHQLYEAPKSQIHKTDIFYHSFYKTVVNWIPTKERISFFKKDFQNASLFKMQRDASQSSCFFSEME